ncbi:hypothetical protein K438DRAFT_1969708 [Mycena galopus ATCC 62051]|nr:hypothetical protein K438DRAFT_1969708 [Mycena galopus ATCC 62051]
MSPTPVVQLARQFVICVFSSFIVILGVIHILGHLVHASVVSETTLRSPLAALFGRPAVQIAQIADIPEHVFIVFKMTFACSVLVFALRDLVSLVGSWAERMNSEGKTKGDLEAAWDRKVDAHEANPAEKRSGIPSLPIGRRLILPILAIFAVSHTPTTPSSFDPA